MKYAQTTLRLPGELMKQLREEAERRAISLKGMLMIILYDQFHE